MMSSPPTQTLLFCDIKAPTPTARVLTLERFSLEGMVPRLAETLIVPEDPEAVVSKVATDRFFLNMQDCVGYRFQNRELRSPHKEWRRIDSFLANLPLVDVKQLLDVFFPTLMATGLAEYRGAFCVAEDLSSSQALVRIVEIVQAKATALPGGVKRLLRNVLRAASKPFGEWFDKVPAGGGGIGDSLNRDYFIELDRFENLTSGHDLTADGVRLLFAGGSPLEKEISGYEPRKGQARYAAAVGKGMEQGQIVLVEAATGTGKSMGYLLPAIARCFEEKSRIVIVTRTKSLQEQLFRSDLQKIRSLIPSGLRIALLKGLANYLCLLKYKLFVSNLAEAAAKLPPLYLAALAVWEHDTHSGDLTETEIFDQPDAEALLDRVTLDETTCLGRQCSFYVDCYGFRARKHATKAGLVITNYALLFSDLRSDGAILGKFSHAIFDEAHRLEAEATSSLTENLGLLAFARSLERVSSDRFKHTVIGFLGKSEASSQVVMGLQANGLRLTDYLRSVALRVLPELRSSGRGIGERIRFKPGDRLHLLLADAWGSEQGAFGELAELLAPLLKLAPATEEESEWEGVSAIKQLAAQIVNHIDVFKVVAVAAEGSVVMWGQYFDSGEAVITAAPAAVGKVLAARLYSRFHSVILTSATLDSEDDFKWIGTRLGLTAETKITPVHLKIHSPFPLSEQLKIMLARYLPPPSSEMYSSRLAQLILKLRGSVRLPTLVLCTSYRMIEALAKPLGAGRGQSGEVLVQMPDSVPQMLLTRFKQSPNPILIGTESFWEGIDLPGELLRLLILTRLPFPVPDDPLELAKQEEAEARGENPFMTVSLPAAILKFRQGIGRMIRNSSDWGAVVITDSRMGTKRYGRLFYDAAPSPIENYEHESLLVKETSGWLGQMQGNRRA
jgi:ATP-dependent DNA helicase DinG